MAVPREPNMQRPKAEKGQHGGGVMASGLPRQGGQGGESLATDVQCCGKTSWER